MQFKLSKDANEVFRLDENFKFDRIYLSNIPDYTSLLYAFIECLPQLKQKEKKSFIMSSLMLNCGSWRNYEHYMYASSLMESFEKCRTLLNAEYIQGDVLMIDPLWTISSSKFQIPLDRREDITNWLMRILLTSSFPSQRDSRSFVRENYPLNLVTFFRSIQYLLDLGYPKHWFSSLVQSILDNDVYSCVPYPTKSPNSFQTLPLERKVNLASISIEFEVIARIFSPILGLLEPSAAATSLDTIFKYDIAFPSYRPNLGTGEYDSESLLGLLIEEAPQPKTRIRDEFVDDKRHFLAKQLFSVLKFDSRKRVASFWMCENKLAELNRKCHSLHASLIRTDSWQRIYVPPIPLAKAKKMNSFLSYIN